MGHVFSRPFKLNFLILAKLDIETKITNFLHTILHIMLKIKKYNF